MRASALSLALIAGLALVSPAFAAGDPVGNRPGGNQNGMIGVYEPWTLLDAMPPDNPGDRTFVRPQQFQGLLLDLNQMTKILAGAPLEGTGADPVVIALPAPDGSFRRFAIVESPIMEPGLAAQFPDFKTYAGVGIDDPWSNVRLDVTTHGFRAQVLSANGSFWIDPWTMGDTGLYTSYTKDGLGPRPAWSCGVGGNPDAQIGVPKDPFQARDLNRSGPTRRQYRLANAATVEYTAFFGGTVAAGQAAIVTAINRVTQVYENEVAVRLVLVANNSNLVYTTTDPYTNSNGSTMLGQNQSNITTVIGSANYDIGHVFSTGGGGIAGLGVVCNSSNKARGVTGLDSPTGDAFYIDYVAHEMGHQFGANHTFNGNDSNCGANRNAGTAYEPGSGSTIMAYAGICAPNNLQNNSDAYFHSISFDEILSFITGTATCSVNTATGNTAPTISAGPAYTIPIGTPFVLTASGSDPNGDALTYCWEQRLLGSSQGVGGSPSNIYDTAGLGPYIRSRSPLTSPSRTIPRIDLLAANTFQIGETLPAISRNVSWRVTARDNKLNGGGVNTADVTIATTTAAGPFQVTSQSSAVTYGNGSTQTVTWNVANTTAAPVSTANVRILWSTDGGLTYPTVLVASTPNDGSQSVVIPTGATSQGRIRVEAIGNIFFDINNANITVPGAPAAPTSPLATPSSICAGGTSTLTASGTTGQLAIDWYAGGCGTAGGGTLVGTGGSLVVSPAVTTTYFALRRNLVTGGLSDCVSVTVTVGPGPTAPTSVASSENDLCQNGSGPITLTATGGSGTTLRWFSGSCGGTMLGTGNGLVIPRPTATTTYFARWESSCGVTGCASTTVTVRNCPADFNCDGFVDDTDFVAFAEAYDQFTVPPASASCDLNNDGFVDDSDFVIFAGAYDAFACP